jgi:hypothetical protein
MEHHPTWLDLTHVALQGATLAVAILTLILP